MYVYMHRMQTVHTILNKGVYIIALAVLAKEVGEYLINIHTVFELKISLRHERRSKQCIGKIFTKPILTHTHTLSLNV